MRTKLGGVAVATIEGALCTSCRNFVPSAVIGRVRAGRELVKCENCRRILVIKP
jgi:predicted  nucleic acid-binding Zn-ribbon protein